VVGVVLAYHQVTILIVIGVAVDVMDHRACGQRFPERLLRYYAMLADVVLPGFKFDADVIAVCPTAAPARIQLKAETDDCVTSHEL
jgi:hypothetical protein